MQNLVVRSRSFNPSLY